MSAKDLPSWSDLSGDSDTESEAPRNTWYFVVIVAVLAAGLTMYVGHVKSTQHLIVDLQEQRNLNHQLLMQKEHLQGEYDRVTGPSIIYDRAAALGLEQTAGPVYQLTPPSE